MEAITFPQQNVTFTKPESMTDEECGSLPAYRGEGQIISCWKLSPEDLNKVQETGIIWLSIVGSQQPPVWVGPDSPFIE